MCGIIAFLSNEDKSVYKYLLDALKLIQNRGYDSAGICCINKENKFVVRKTAEKLDVLEKYTSEFKGCTIGIAHTRWSTHGETSEINAHPHIDSDNKFALVHNGIIENYMELKTMLIKDGFTFKSQTDTEVIVNLISYQSRFTEDIHTCITEATKHLVGSWALSIISLDDPNTLFFAKNGSPLLIGYNDNYLAAASESIGFYNRVENYIELGDGDILSASIVDGEIKLNTDKEYRLQKIIKSTLENSPYPFKYWTMKEIMEQPLTVQKAMNMGGRIKNDREVRLRGIENHKEKLLSLKNIVVVASGTSLNAGKIGVKYFQYLRGIDNITWVDASEFCEYDLPLSPDTAMIVLSQSGETKDVHLAMQIARERGVFILSIVNSVNSLIAREADTGIYVNAGREVGVASTKSFTSQVVVLSLLACWFAQHKNVSEDKRIKMIRELKELPLDIENSIKCFESINEIVENIKDEQSMFILGRHFNEPIAIEGSLKIKEISYIHAEGYPSGSLKHGPLALIQKNRPVILISPDNEDYQKMESCAQEVRTRGARTIIITNKDKVDMKLFDHCVKVPHNDTYSSLLSMIPLQILAYELSISKGINPDMPKNLAKCVTVA